MWLNRKDRPEEACRCINQVCDFQNEYFKVIYFDNQKFMQHNLNKRIVGRIGVDVDVDLSQDEDENTGKENKEYSLLEGNGNGNENTEIESRKNENKYEN